MINVYDVLVDKMPEVGARAVGVAIAIAKFMDKNNEAWPKRETLRAITGLGRDALDSDIKALAKARVLTKEQRRGKSGFRMSSNKYRINPKYLKKYNSLVTDSQDTESQDTESQDTENPPVSIEYNIEVLNIKEVLNKDKLVDKDKKALVTENPYTEKWTAAILKDQMFLETADAVHKVKNGTVNDLLQVFVKTKTTLQEDGWRTYNDFRKNFLYWIPKNKQRYAKQQSHVSNPPTKGKEVWSTDEARKAYASLRAKDCAASGDDLLNVFR